MNKFFETTLTNAMNPSKRIQLLLYIYNSWVSSLFSVNQSVQFLLKTILWPYKNQFTAKIKQDLNLRALTALTNP